MVSKRSKPSTYNSVLNGPTGPGSNLIRDEKLARILSEHGEPSPTSQTPLQISGIHSRAVYCIICNALIVDGVPSSNPGMGLDGKLSITRIDAYISDP